MNTDEYYKYIEQKISYLKENYQSLRNKSDDYGFSALCIKSNFFKNPALDFDDRTIEKMMVDGTGDGGVDALLSDPNSDESNLVLVQSKYYQKISYEDLVNAITKMVRFYNDMSEGNYHNFNHKVISRFCELKAEIGDESKIIFVVYTSASKNNIRKDRLDKAFNSMVDEPNKYELRVYFDENICDEIKEAESRRPDVESGKLIIDESNNYLSYNDEAVIANVSAWCIKELYATHGLNLLAKNLRYHVTGANIDRAIKESIRNNPEDFWFKNNGITIICDDFDISGNQIKLKHFSIVNGGQTTYNLFKCGELNKENDFYLPCKVIITKGENQDEKNVFALEIAKATNSQKAIKPVDLKANSVEQVRFANTMIENGIFYQTKRGEVVPKQYKLDYLNSDLADIGKLCLGGIFQMPGTSRNKPSVIYNQEYYEPIFNGNQDKIAKISKELLYVDYYYRNVFSSKFDEKNAGLAISGELLPFAHNSRTICIAFTALACRYSQGNLDETKMKEVFDNIKEGETSKKCYDIFRNLDDIDTLFDKNLFNDKDKLDEVLYKLFDAIIKEGRKLYSYKKEADSTLNESNFLKKDFNYYSILKKGWDEFPEKIRSAFGE